MPETRLLTRFVRLLFAALLAVVPCFLSCNGNGGSHDGGGATYVPGGGSGSSGGGTTGNLTESFTTEDLWNLSNAGNAYRIVELLSTNQAMEQTQTIVLQAAAIGLPAGGSATLTISGGIAFSGTVQAAADGTVTFVIPATPNGITITVALSVANASGTVLYSGSSQETLSDDWLDINLPLYRLFWTLPASISLTASPDGFAYDSTKLSETTMLSISGLEDAPAGAAISYAWELDASPLPDSGPTLTRSWNELIGPTVPTGELTKTFTVTVSYTDIAGEAKTASASTDVIIGPPVTIPSFTIKVNPPTSYDTANSNASQYALMNNSDPFTFEVELPAGTEFPTGTTLSWAITKVGGTTPVNGTGTSVSKTPADLGVTTSVGTWNITCTASNSRAAAPVSAPAKMMQAKVLVLPSITLIQTSSVTGCAPADNTSFSGDTYAFANASSGSFTLTAVTSGTAVTGMKYNWSISGSPFSYDSTTSNTCTVNLSDLTGFAGHKNSAGSWTVTCELTYTGLSSVSQTTTLSAFLLVIPEFTVSVSAGTGLYEASTSTPTSRVFLVGTTDLSKSLTFTATPKAGEPAFPEGTSFTWSCTLGTSASENVGISTFATAVPSSQTTYPPVTCQPRCAGIYGDMEWVDFDLNPRTRLSAPTGLTLGLPYAISGGSVTVGASNQFTFPSGTDIANVCVPLSWTAPDVPADKKFKFSIYVDNPPSPTVTGNFNTSPGAACDCTLGGANETGGWGTHTIYVVTVIDPNDPEYENSVPAGPITVTLNSAP